MKYLLLILLFVLSSCAREIKDNDLRLGTGASTNINIEGDVGTANNPTLRYDVSDGKWKYSNDGLVFENMISAGSVSIDINALTEKTPVDDNDVLVIEDSDDSFLKKKIKISSLPGFGATDLATDVTGILPIANGGTGSSTQNFVDLTTNQTVGGDKSFTGNMDISTSNGTPALDIAHSGSADALVVNQTGAGSALNTEGRVLIRDTVAGADPFVRIMNNAATTAYFSVNENGMQLASSGARVSTILDEDDMATNSATALATQQSIKAYVDTEVGGLLPSQTGNNGKYLTTDGTDLSWATVSSGSIDINALSEKTPLDDDDVFVIEDSNDTFAKKKVKASTIVASGGTGIPLLAKGSLLTSDGSNNGELTVGPNGKILGADSTETSGLKWIDPPVALPDQSGNSGRYLRTNGTTASWQNVNNDTADIKTNLLLCPSFEGCGLTTDSWAVTTDATLNGSGTGTRTIEASAYNDSHAYFEGLISPTWDIKAVVTKTADFSGQQMKAYCEIRTLRPDVKFIAGANSVSAGEQNVINDGKWRFYEVFLVGGNTSQYIEINGETTASAEPIYVDNCFIGKVSPNDIREVSGAQFAGRVQRITSAQTVSTTSPTKIQFNSAEFSLGSFDTVTNYRYSPERIGKYLVNASVYLASVATGVVSELYVYKNGTLVTGCAFFDRVDSGSDGFVKLSCVVGIDSLTDYIEFFVTTGDSSYSVIASNVTSAEIYYFPDSTSNIVTQNTELTAKTANEFVANVSSTGVVSGENFDWINGNCSVSDTSQFVCNWKAGLFSTAPVCSVTVNDGSWTGNDLNARGTESTSSITVRTYYDISSAVKAPFPFKLSCTRSTDYNKSATIIGKFNAENMGDNMKTKCQTKVLSASVTTTGIVSDLTFDNLNIGKKYQITFYAKLRSTAASHAVSVIEFEDPAGVDVVPMMRALLSFPGANLDNWLTFNPSLFTASNSVLRVNVTDISGVRVEAGSYVQLCELPDTYVETTEW